MSVADMTECGRIAALFTVRSGDALGFLHSRSPRAYLDQGVRLLVVLERMTDAEKIRQAMSGAGGRA